MTQGLAGRVALVTGAARGQGRAHAVEVAAAGADVIALDICDEIPGVPYALAGQDDLAETVRLVEKEGVRAQASAVDVRDVAALTAVVDDAVRALGRLDCVCINAGIAIPAPLMQISVADWRTTIDTNLTGAFHTLKATVPHVLAGGRGGSIVFTSSSATLRPFWNLGGYVCSKYGIVGLTVAAALELAPHNIRVNSVHPTSVFTPMLDNPHTRRLFVPDVEEPTVEQVAAVTRTLNALPVSFVEAQDVAHAVAFLFSDEARHITGVQFPVDAGCGLL